MINIDCLIRIAWCFNYIFCTHIGEIFTIHPQDYDSFPSMMGVNTGGGGGGGLNHKSFTIHKKITLQKVITTYM